MDEMKNILSDELYAKYQRLLEYLKSFGRLTVAYSGGVDSTLLLYAAKQTLGGNVLAVTADSHLFPERELSQTQQFCREHEIEQIVCRMEEMKIEGFRENPPGRCYLCKKHLFQTFLDVSREHGIDAVAEGSNLDDEGDYRPGMQAIAELGIISPLRTCGFIKQDIRAISRALGIKAWDKPSYACLASRFAYGETISEEKLKMVERAEQLLQDMGFLQERVRIHGTIARIEVMPDQFQQLIGEECRTRITEAFKEIGFSYTALDLTGYRTGSMNEVLDT